MNDHTDEPRRDINDRTSALLGFDLQTEIRKARNMSITAALARAKADHLEHSRKVVLAQAILDAREAARLSGQKVTVDEIEARARTSEAYTRHLDDLLAAQEERGVAYAKSSGAERTVELGFRQLSFLQSELKNEGR